MRPLSLHQTPRGYVDDLGCGVGGWSGPGWEFSGFRGGRQRYYGVLLASFLIRIVVRPHERLNRTLLDQYATVTDGSSALLRADLLALCQKHAVSEPQFCDTFAQELASRYASGDLDADRAAFAADDLHAAADFTLPPFARRVFDLLEYREGVAVRGSAVASGSQSWHCGLTIHSSRTRFAGRLNSGVRRCSQDPCMPYALYIH